MSRTLTKAESTSPASQVARTPTMVEFAASIAHEIKRPLSSVVLSAEASLHWIMRNDLDAARNAIRTVAQEGMRAGEMVGALLALAKQSQPMATHCSINEVIDDVVARTHKERIRHGIVLRLDLLTVNQSIFGSRVQLQQVMLNLVMNGIEAMKAVTGRSRILTISLQLAENGGVLVAVKDTGPGVDPAAVDRIFDPFFTTKTGGMGMGLSICRSIIEAYGGRIWASPCEVYGTAFRFIVPAASPESNPTGAPGKCHASIANLEMCRAPRN